MSANSLTGIFAPGAPALLESLRTLVISPRPSVDPGQTLSLEFSFSNVGGAPATGVRARFALPAGVSVVPASDMLDDAPLAEGESFFASGGADVGDLAPHQQRRISARVRVNELIEDGTTLAFQAAVVSDQLAVTGSNIERITVRSRPELSNAQTLLTILAEDAPAAGDVITVRATIVNTGPSSAHDVVAVLPTPEHTTYVPGSARVAGRPVSDQSGEPFDYDAGTVVAPRLAPSQSILVEYQAEIESPLDDQTRIKAHGIISARELAEFSLTSSEIVVHSPVDFNNDQTSLTVYSDDAVTPGTRIAMALQAANFGSGPAQGVVAHFALPEGLVYSPGSAMIDGQPITDDAFASGAIELGTIGANRTVEVGLSAMVAVPPEGDYPLPIRARVAWRGGERQFSRTLTVRATARFARSRNFVEVDRRTAQAEEDVDFRIHLFNDGTAADRGSRLRIIPGAHLGDVRAVEEQGTVPYTEPVDLGTLDPHDERIVTVRAKIVPPVPDRWTLTLGAVLEQADKSIDLGSGSLVVRSRPRVQPESVVWERPDAQTALRPGDACEIVIRFTNDGSDTLQDAHVVLEAPSELVLERAQDAQREHSTLHFGDVPAKTSHEARLTVRLLRAESGNHSLHLNGIFYGRGISSVALAPLEILTFSQPDFAPAATLRVTPSQDVLAGDRIAYELLFRNSGDGPARELIARIIPSNLAVYVPGSTVVNGLLAPDDVGTSPLWSQRGLQLTDIDPGVSVRVRFEMIVVSPLASGTPIDARAVLAWDGDQSVSLSAPTLTVQAAPSLAATLSTGAISIKDTLQSQPQLDEGSVAWQQAPAVVERAPEPADVVPRPQDRGTTQQLPPQLAEIVEQQPPVIPRPAQPDRGTAPPPAVIPRPQERGTVPAPGAVGAPIGYVDFNRDRLERTLKLLDGAELDGMLSHLFAIRAFFPENAINSSAEVERAFRAMHRALTSILDRLFVRLRVPRYTLTAKDLEDRDSRYALRQLVTMLLQNNFSQGAGSVAQGVIRVCGPIDTTRLSALQAELESTPLGSVVPWLIAANLIGTTIATSDNESHVLGEYREKLIDAFGTLQRVPMEEFHRVLRGSVNRALDESLTEVIEALRETVSSRA